MSEKKQMSCILTSPEKTTVYEGLRSISVPASSGLMQILCGHAESFVMIIGGVVTLKNVDDRIETFLIGESECHIRDNKIVIVT
jgi:F0F1-type ATP synthase epsilon subunit